MFNCCQCPSAKMSDSTLVLSLPNAMTPVVWMIDMTSAGTFVMKVENTDNGLFVLQKISNDGKNVEDIAYYASKKKAVKAMAMVTNVKNGQSKKLGLWGVLSFLKSSLLIVACLGIILFLGMLYFPKIERLVLGVPVQPSTQQSVQAPQQQNQTVTTNPDAVGVPIR